MTTDKTNRRALLAAGLLLGPGLAGAAGGHSKSVDNLAIYNQGASVVQDTRKLDLEKGAQTIDWPVSARVNPATFWLQAPAAHLTGLEASAQGENDGQQGLAARIGRPVTLLLDRANGKTLERRATLVAVTGDSVQVRADDRIERLTAGSPWRLSWPAGKARSAAVQLYIDADHAGRQKLTATYQTSGPSWQASYTGRFQPQTGKLALQAMAVIDNSGNARLAAKNAWLVAGDVSRTGGGHPRPVMMAARRAEASTAGAPRAAGAYYRYPLAGGLSVAAGAVRAVSLMPPLSFDAERSYRFEHDYRVPGHTEREHASVRLSLTNSAEQPLPAGQVRVYSAQRSPGLMGEDRIDDTPRNAPIHLELGKAFDVTGERRITADRQTDDQRQRAIAITLYNAGKQKANVHVVEHLPQAGKVVSSSPRPVATSAADRIGWKTQVPAGARTQVKYTVVWPHTD